MAITKEMINTAKKDNHVIVDTQKRDIGLDENGLPDYETIYENPPLNFLTIKVYESLNCAVLKDLDYATSSFNLS